ncbi:MAG: hypothetical protein ACD_3C00114G0001 [uncultured bacterium (gcode 4)]|uniref:LamG-like jellyroll fold domain-containing protein n=1 Tax=uncultured bacterium (gcode 4) TaxID=1234023 RepID=K2G189_9BACT|nr:MAG: hypothetical protein ACD_3C00114G0001 [uncultured bacterium (gcode 4)]
MWDLLGIVLESSTKVPAQAAMNDIDVSKTNTWYIEQFTNKDYIIWTWSSLLSNILIRRNDLSDDTTLLKYDDSILGYWNMETTTWAYLKDLSRYENLWTLNWVIAWGVNWIKWKATNFTWTWGYIKASDNSNWNIGSKNMTINLWIKQSSYSAGWNRLVSSWDGGSSNYGTSQFVFYVSSTWEIVGNFWNWTGWQATTLITSPNIILLNNWYNIQIIFDTTQIKVYVNNELKKSSTRPALQNSTKLQIWWWDWDLPYSWINRYFQGSIDEVRIYNRALWESETQALYESLK